MVTAKRRFALDPTGSTYAKSFRNQQLPEPTEVSEDKDEGTESDTCLVCSNGSSGATLPFMELEKKISHAKKHRDRNRISFHAAYKQCFVLPTPEENAEKDRIERENEAIYQLLFCSTKGPFAVRPDRDPFVSPQKAMPSIHLDSVAPLEVSSLLGDDSSEEEENTMKNRESQAKTSVLTETVGSTDEEGCSPSELEQIERESTTEDMEEIPNETIETNHIDENRKDEEQHKSSATKNEFNESQYITSNDETLNPSPRLPTDEADTGYSYSEGTPSENESTRAMSLLQKAANMVGRRRVNIVFESKKNKKPLKPQEEDVIYLEENEQESTTRSKLSGSIPTKALVPKKNTLKSHKDDASVFFSPNSLQLAKALLSKHKGTTIPSCQKKNIGPPKDTKPQDPSPTSGKRDIEFLTESELESTINQVAAESIEEEIFECSVCDEAFVKHNSEESFVKKIRRHLIGHISVPLYTCRSCGKPGNDFSEHQRKAHPKSQLAKKDWMFRSNKVPRSDIAPFISSVDNDNAKPTDSSPDSESDENDLNFSDDEDPIFAGTRNRDNEVFPPKKEVGEIILSDDEDIVEKEENSQNPRDISKSTAMILESHDPKSGHDHASDSVVSLDSTAINIFEDAEEMESTEGAEESTEEQSKIQAADNRIEGYFEQPIDIRPETSQSVHSVSKERVDFPDDSLFPDDLADDSILGDPTQKYPDQTDSEYQSCSADFMTATTSLQERDTSLMAEATDKIEENQISGQTIQEMVDKIVRKSSELMKFECPNCDKQIKITSNLTAFRISVKRHILHDLSSQPYQCSHCSDRYADLYCHKKKHQNEKWVSLTIRDDIPRDKVAPFLAYLAPWGLGVNDSLGSEQSEELEIGKGKEDEDKRGEKKEEESHYQTIPGNLEIDEPFSEEETEDGGTQLGDETTGNCEEEEKKTRDARKGAFSVTDLDFSGASISVPKSDPSGDETKENFAGSEAHNLLIHVLRIAVQEKKVQCSSCRATLTPQNLSSTSWAETFKGKIQTHIISHGPQKPFSCSHCNHRGNGLPFNEYLHRKISHNGDPTVFMLVRPQAESELLAAIKKSFPDLIEKKVVRKKSVSSYKSASPVLEISRGLRISALIAEEARKRKEDEKKLFPETGIQNLPSTTRKSEIGRNEPPKELSKPMGTVNVKLGTDVAVNLFVLQLEGKVSQLCKYSSLGKEIVCSKCQKTFSKHNLPNELRSHFLKHITGSLFHCLICSREGNTFLNHKYRYHKNEIYTKNSWVPKPERTTEALKVLDECYQVQAQSRSEIPDPKPSENRSQNENAGDSIFDPFPGYKFEKSRAGMDISRLENVFEGETVSSNMKSSSERKNLSEEQIPVTDTCQMVSTGGIITESSLLTLLRQIEPPKSSTQAERETHEALVEPSKQTEDETKVEESGDSNIPNPTIATRYQNAAELLDKSSLKWKNRIIQLRYPNQSKTKAIPIASKKPESHPKINHLYQRFINSSSEIIAEQIETPKGVFCRLCGERFKTSIAKGPKKATETEWNVLRARRHVVQHFGTFFRCPVCNCDTSNIMEHLTVCHHGIQFPDKELFIKEDCFLQAVNVFRECFPFLPVPPKEPEEKEKEHKEEKKMVPDYENETQKEENSPGEEETTAEVEDKLSVAKEGQKLAEDYARIAEETAEAAWKEGGKLPTFCMQCGLSFPKGLTQPIFSQVIKEHALSHINDKAYKCILCEAEVQNVKNHYLMYHEDATPPENPLVRPEIAEKAVNNLLQCFPISTMK